MYISDSFLKVILYALAYWTISFSTLYLILIILKTFFKEKIRISYRTIHISFICSLLVYIFISIFAQYEVWSRSDFTRVFTQVPVKANTPFPEWMAILKPLFTSKHGYLLHYSFTHYASSIVLGLMSALIFFGLLKIIMKFKPYLINSSELNVIIAGCLAFAWPYSIGYIVVLFVLFLVHNIINSLRGNERTMIMPASVIAVFVMFIIANFITSTQTVFASLYTVMPK